MTSIALSIAIIKCFRSRFLCLPGTWQVTLANKQRQVGGSNSRAVRSVSRLMSMLPLSKGSSEIARHMTDSDISTTLKVCSMVAVTYCVSYRLSRMALSNISIR